MAPGTSPKPCIWGIAEKSFQNAAQESLFQVINALQSIQVKLLPEPDEGKFTPCILPRKIDGLQNLMVKRYFSKIPFLISVHLSKYNIKLVWRFRKFQKKI